MKPLTIITVFLVVSTILTISCTNQDVNPHESDSKEIIVDRYGVGEEAGRRFLKENKTQEGVTSHASGLQTKIISSGPAKGESPSPSAFVRYESIWYLVDGTSVPSPSREKNNTTEAVVQLLMPGIEEALAMMRVGDRWMLYIPPELAYGSKGTGILGPNESVIIDITLLEVDEQKGEFMLSLLPGLGTRSHRSNPVLPG